MTLLTVEERKDIYKHHVIWNVPGFLFALVSNTNSAQIATNDNFYTHVFD